MGAAALLYRCLALALSLSLSQHTAELRFLHSRSNLGSCGETEISISGEIESRISGVACGSYPSCAVLSSSMAQSSRQWGATGGEGTSGERGSSLESDS